MRELLVNEIQTIHGGLNTGGVTFSHIVISGAVAGTAAALLGSDFVFWGCVGASFASLMMVARALDCYFFEESQYEQEVVHIIE